MILAFYMRNPAVIYLTKGTLDEKTIEAFKSLGRVWVAETMSGRRTVIFLERDVNIAYVEEMTISEATSLLYGKDQPKLTIPKGGRA